MVYRFKLGAFEIAESRLTDDISRHNNQPYYCLFSGPHFSVYDIFYTLKTHEVSTQGPLT